MTDANAVRFFQNELAYRSSPREVADGLAAGEQFTLVDVRLPDSFARGHLPGAINVPLSNITAGKVTLDKNDLVVVYDWGPANTDSAKACLALAGEGYQVREMIGGFEYWSRIGFDIETSKGQSHRAPDPLVTSRFD